MSPLPGSDNGLHVFETRNVIAKVQKPSDPHGLVLEAWAEGFMVGALIIMSCVTAANMRRGVLLHKLILLELVMGYWQGFMILFDQPIYAWWLSVAAIPLNSSWILHNVIAWMKLRPFLSKWWSRLFIGTVILSIPYWITEIYANFTYFHNVNRIFLKTRPWEALCRDPWWVGAAVFLVYKIKTEYDLGITQIVRISPRFAVMLGAMFLSVCFILLDVLSVTSVLKNALPVGINPFWKLSFVFKCLTDSVVLDDFKTALDRLRAFKISRLGSFAIDNNDRNSKMHKEHIDNANGWADAPPKGVDHIDHTATPVRDLPPMPSPDGDYIHSTWTDPVMSGVHQTDFEKYGPMARTGSRDRDIEENPIRPSTVETHTTRAASETPILGRQDSWSHSGSGSTDIDAEYAMAVRELTNDDSRQNAKKGRGIGVAR